MTPALSAKRLIPAALIFGAAVIVLSEIAAALTNHSVGEFTRDIRSLSGEAGGKVPFYAGAVSQLNCMVWASAGALAVLVGYLEPIRRRWLLAFAALLFVFAADDSQTLHESGPKRFIPEVAFYVVYAVVGLVLLAALLRREIDDSTVAFVAGGVLLAVSILVDELFVHQYLWEDGPKLLGALLWLTVPPLCLRTQRQPLRRDGARAARSAVN